jgi:hypothetical protein
MKMKCENGDECPAVECKCKVEHEHNDNCKLPCKDIDNNTVICKEVK